MEQDTSPMVPRNELTCDILSGHLLRGTDRRRHAAQREPPDRPAPSPLDALQHQGAGELVEASVTDPGGRGRSRWDLAMASLCEAFAYGALYAGPVYRAAAAAEFGWSQEAASGAFAVGFLAASLIPCVAGLAADRWGAHRVLAAGTTTAALALLTAATTSTLWQWYITAGIALALGVRTVSSGASFVASVHERRGRSLGVVVGGLGTGLIVGPPLAQLLLDTFGWRSALALEGTALALLACLLLGTSPRRAAGAVPERCAPGPLVKDPGPSHAGLIVGFCLGNVLLGLYDESVYQHAYAYGKELGLLGTAATGVISGISVAYVVGAVGGGTLSDRIGRRPLLVGGALGAAAALLGIAHSSRDTLWLWGVVFGLALGMSIAVRSAAWADAFAGPWLGRDVGLVTPGYSVGAALMTSGGAAWLDAGGSFQALYVASALAAILWALLGGALCRRHAR